MAKSSPFRWQNEKTGSIPTKPRLEARVAQLRRDAGWPWINTAGRSEDDLRSMIAATKSYLERKEMEAQPKRPKKFRPAGPSKRQYLPGEAERRRRRTGEFHEWLTPEQRVVVADAMSRRA